MTAVMMRARLPRTIEAPMDYANTCWKPDIDEAREMLMAGTSLSVVSVDLALSVGFLRRHLDRDVLQKGIPENGLIELPAPIRDNFLRRDSRARSPHGLARRSAEEMLALIGEALWAIEMGVTKKELSVGRPHFNSGFFASYLPDRLLYPERARVLYLAAYWRYVAGMDFGWVAEYTGLSESTVRTRFPDYLKNEGISRLRQGCSGSHSCHRHPRCRPVELPKRKAEHDEVMLRLPTLEQARDMLVETDDSYEAVGAACGVKPRDLWRLFPESLRAMVKERRAYVRQHPTRWYPDDWPLRPWPLPRDRWGFSNTPLAF